MAGFLNFFSRKQGVDEFEQLLQPHISQLYRLAYRYTRTEHAAEDLLQDFMVHIYPKYDELKQIENLRSWLARSLYNRFIDNIRKDKRNPISDAEDDTVLETMSGFQPAPEREMEQHIVNERLLIALDQINDDQRLVVMLHDMEGYTLAELSDMLNVPVGTLKSRLHRARNSIKTLMMMEPSDSLLRLKG